MATLAGERECSNPALASALSGDAGGEGGGLVPTLRLAGSTLMGVSGTNNCRFLDLERVRGARGREILSAGRRRVARGDVTISASARAHPFSK